MKKAAETTRESYEKAIIKRTKHAEEIHELFESIDALITPMFPRMHMAATEQPDLSGNHRRFTIPISYLGLPGVSVPCGFSGNGLPIGMQVVGNRLQEGLILRISAAYERATEFHTRRPPVMWE